MRKYLFSLCASLFVFICLANFSVISNTVVSNTWAAAGQATNTHRLFTTATGQTITVGDGLIIKFKNSTSIKNQLNVLKSSGCSATASFKIVSNLTHASITSSRSLTQTLALLRANPYIEYAEPNAIFSISAIPNDPQFINLYGLNNSGQTGGTFNADIDAPQAWDISTGTNTIIAVVDTGLDYNHVDIQANVWSNTAEIANNGIDDDGNGYIDDVRGWDFVNNDNDPMDDNDHGTHVSGTIAAVGNNGRGVTGVNWSARVMPLKFMSATGAGSTIDSIAAIDYAVANGARVINASWGSSFSSTALSDAITAANSAGVLFVAAAGNNGTDNDATPAFPAGYDIPNIISVAATNFNDTLAVFSNFGLTTVDLAAPGVSILSTVPANGYASLSGTSMATPHVAGVAGLALSVDSTLSLAALKSAILNNVDQISSLIGTSVTGGRLNAFNTINSVSNTPAPPPPVAITIIPNTATVPVGGNIQFSATGSTPPYTWSSSSTIASITSAGGLLTAISPGFTTVTATDGTGNTGTSGNINIIQVQISPSSATLSVGATQQFVATGGFPPYAWRSSNTGVASVNSTTGLLTALASGTITLSVVDNVGATASTNNIVITQPAITPQTAILATGDTLQFSASGGAAPYTWSTTNATVASINTTNGLLTALAAGTTTISATDANGATASSGAITIRNITVSPQTATVNTGNTLQFTAAGGAIPYSWSSSNPAIASINANTGLLTSLAAGTITVTATDSTAQTATTGNIVVSDVVVTPQTATVNTGATQLFSATGGTAPYTWTSSNTAVASINTTTGLITAIAPGTTIINATDANNITGSSNTITVVALPAPTITVTAPATTINVGNTLQLSASGGAAPYTWSVDNPAVASIGTTNGLLSGLSAGTVVVTATDADNFTGVSISISIADPTVPALPPQIQPQTSLLPVTGTVQLNVLNGTAPFTWSTSNPATTITPIDATTIQLSTTAAGTTTVTVTDANNINATTGVIEFRAISVNSPIVSVDIGATLQITVTGGRAPYTWMVNNPGIATINATGLLTGVTAGSVNVTATDVDNFSGNAVVSVITPAATIVISPQTFSLPVGNTLSFRVNGAFGGMMGAGALIWTSSDPTVATVNNFGVLTAVSSGTTVITVSDSVGNVGSTGIITVEPPPPIAVTPQTASVRAGRWLLFTATGGTGTYTWASGDSTIATIDTNGWLFGVAPGTVTVTATDSAGGNTTTGVITITPGGMHQ